MNIKTGLTTAVTAPLAIAAIVIVATAWATHQVAKAVENLADVEAWDDDEGWGYDWWGYES